MAGCFGGSAIDRHLENRLDEHLSSCDNETIEFVEETYGEHLGTDEEGNEVFKEGYGNPSIEIEEDPDGKYRSIKGMDTARCYEIKGSDKVLVKLIRFVQGKRKPRVQRVDSVFSVNIQEV